MKEWGVCGSTLHFNIVIDQSDWMWGMWVISIHEHWHWPKWRNEGYVGPHYTNIGIDQSEGMMGMWVHITLQHRHWPKWLNVGNVGHLYTRTLAKVKEWGQCGSILHFNIGIDQSDWMKGMWVHITRTLALAKVKEWGVCGSTLHEHRHWPKWRNEGYVGPHYTST